MKKYLFVVMLITCFYCSALAQTEVVLSEILREDKVEVLNAYLNDHDINECFEIRTSSYNLISIALKTESTNVAKYLIENGADLNQVCQDKTPLMYAAKYGQTELAKLMIAKGADPSKKSSQGKTLKDYALKYKNESLLIYLEQL